MPTPDSIYGALAPDIGAGAGALPSDALVNAMARIAAARRAQMGVPPAAPAPSPALIGSQSSLAPNTQVAGLGQRYSDWPSASFDDRFGPYSAGPAQTPDEIRRMREQEQFLRQPGAIMPGRSKSWPAGFTQI